MQSCQVKHPKVADSGFNKVIKATVFLVDIQDFSAVNEIYKQFFLEDYPARAAVQVFSSFYSLKPYCTTVCLGCGSP